MARGAGSKSGSGWGAVAVILLVIALVIAAVGPVFALVGHYLLFDLLPTPRSSLPLILR